MITITINLKDGPELTYKILPKRNAGLAAVFEAAKLLHGEWTSIVITVVNTTKETHETPPRPYHFRRRRG